MAVVSKHLGGPKTKNSLRSVQRSDQLQNFLPCKQYLRAAYGYNWHA